MDTNGGSNFISKLTILSLLGLQGYRLFQKPSSVITMTVTGCASFKNNNSICMLRPYFVFSRLAANTPGLAFAVAVSVSRQIHLARFWVWVGFKNHRNPDKNFFSPLRQSSSRPQAFRVIPGHSGCLKNEVHLFKLTSVARYIWHG